MSSFTILDCFESVLLDDDTVAACKEAGKHARDEFIAREALQPPSVIRLIDCKASCEERQVVIVDYGERQKEVGYSAISHTYGKEVYGVFDCECAAKCLASVPRCSRLPCPGHATRSPRNRIVREFLYMYEILCSAGVQYIWHDGVCIAQHDSAELNDATQCMGWIYANAKETIISLHYFGKPMAPIRHDADYRKGDPLTSRWHTRVWTLQEGAMSRDRRYCIRKGESLSGCQSVEEIERRLAHWYNDETSIITVVEEDEYWDIVKEFYTVLLQVLRNVVPDISIKLRKWIACMNSWVNTLVYTCFSFPTIGTAFEHCSLRESKHVGDRINSILALARVKDFVAPRDTGMEASTITFFKKQGQQGLARAVFTTNAKLLISSAQSIQHSWLPILAEPLASVYDSGVNIYTRRVHSSDVEKLINFTLDTQTGNMKLEGKLACLAVKFTLPKPKVDEAEGFEQHDSNPAILPMYLTFDMASHGFGASLAMDIATLCSEEVSYNQNTTIAMDHSSTDGPSNWELCNAVRTILLSYGTLPSSLVLGRAIIPRRTTRELYGPLIKGEEITAGCSFSGHLLFPLNPLQRHKQFSELHQSANVPQLDWTMPALLIQGDIFGTEPVHKIGCFHLNKQLKDILALLLPSLTIIQQLVIR